jgi:hypothetical protein
VSRLALPGQRRLARAIIRVLVMEVGLCSNSLCTPVRALLTEQLTWQPVSMSSKVSLTVGSMIRQSMVEYECLLLQSTGSS